MSMTLDEFIESGCTSEQINKTSQTDSHFLPESFKKLHEEDCCIAEHLGIDPYYVLGALYQNTTQQKNNSETLFEYPSTKHIRSEPHS